MCDVADINGIGHSGYLEDTLIYTCISCGKEYTDYDSALKCSCSHLNFQKDEV